MKKTREIREKTEAYILSCIDAEGYGVNPTTYKEKLNFLHDTFMSEYGHQLPYYHNNEQTTFVNWCQGLPSCFRIDFENYRILEILREWGVIEPGASVRKEQLYLGYWWNKLYMVFKAMRQRANKPEKKAVRESLTRVEYEIQGHYGRWEAVTVEDDIQEARARLKEYRDNEPGTSFKLVTRRVFKSLRHELQGKLKLTAENFGSHESDLYVRALPEVVQYLRKNYEFWGNITNFISEIDGQEWLDIPFALMNEKLRAKA